MKQARPRRRLRPPPGGGRGDVRGETGQGVGGGPRRADHRDVRLVVEQVAHSAPHPLVVVEQEAPHRVFLAGPPCLL